MKAARPSPPERPPTTVEWWTSPFVSFFKMEAAGGLLLMFSAVVAIVCANTPLAGAFGGIWSSELTLTYGSDFGLSKPLILWVNDGLMAVFFLLVGLEIKREISTGELNTAAKAALPAAAALGGMLVPALIYAGFNFGQSSIRGWGVPMATDIAFSLGILALVGSRVPVGLKVFLTAVAIVDDLGAVVVIAAFYTHQIQWWFLAGSLIAWAAAMIFGRLGGRSTVVFAVLGIVMWYCMLKSGVHATIAGVALAFAIPARRLTSEHASMTVSWEHGLHPWVAFLIVPVFALANAGVALGSNAATMARSPLALGVFFGLFLGKLVGVAGFSWLAVRLGWAAVPAGCRWVDIVGVALLTGVGFTMSLFISELAFETSDDVSAAKIGILMASACAGLTGFFTLKYSGRTAR
jgi:Na+:H+ antiporter, NhaA family